MCGEKPDPDVQFDFGGATHPKEPTTDKFNKIHDAWLKWVCQEMPRLDLLGKLKSGTHTEQVEVVKIAKFTATHQHVPNTGGQDMSAMKKGIEVMTTTKIDTIVEHGRLRTQ